MALIHVLDEVTANQIAAGEVVERPVNAVKEMVENAVDAGASDIEVEIADGGLTYIRVTDNGSGMSAEDAKLSIVRHATSKISTVDNIYHIASLGFRGEALASISAVSRFREAAFLWDALCFFVNVQYFCEAFTACIDNSAGVCYICGDKLCDSVIAASCGRKG